MTPEARAAVQRDRVEIRRFPFRVGRESRVNVTPHGFYSSERRKLVNPPSNDLYMLDRGEALNVSREHFRIEHKEGDSFELVDRGSACGTVVDGRTVGGRDKGGHCPVKDGSVIVVGVAKSPYVFKFVLAPTP